MSFHQLREALVCAFSDGVISAEKFLILYEEYESTNLHALKFQAVVIPSGLVANLYGPVEGRRHDAGMLKESGLLNILQRRAVTPTGDILCIYGDPAYPLRPHLMGPYRDNPLTPQMREFNKAMSEVRVSVEWLFSDIAESFKFIDYKKKISNLG